MKPDLSYNDGNNDATKQWSVGGQNVEGEVVERIDLSEQKPLNNPGCQHENTKRIPSLDFSDQDEIICEDCPLGWFVAR